ncbi:MAG: hypothetical protein QN193_10025 [Armatimonadota bacterium]|nr:hypothetical protein [Armatimonadota bacterium]MDR7444007.1 hypothetical protein [Armatimonadota bacterium]MDR7570933.1 hypothetical protein [Armatimonadota bacterium]MDR7615390.1 hypothetical protein [Armatimonadota bacterium]
MRVSVALLGVFLLALPGLGRPPAAELPESLEVQVTGNPADAEVIREAIARRLEQTVRRLPGATVEIRLPGVPLLEPGEEVVLPVRVEARHPSGAPLARTVWVRLLNLLLPLSDPKRLVVSNNPERLRSPGLLLAERLGPGEAVRLLYHHQNATGRGMVVLVRLKNPGPQPARIHLQVAAPRPWHDTMAAGHAAARRFLQLVASGGGYVLELPPHSAFTFWTQHLPVGFVVSGLLQAQLLEGEGLEIRVGLRPSYVLDPAPLPDLEPEPTGHPRGVFAHPVLEVRRRLAVGASETVEVGASRALRDLFTEAVLVGDYGVLYRLLLELTNPGPEAREARVAVRAAGGPAYAAFVANGQLLDLSYLAAGRARDLLTVPLPPAGSSTVTLLTVPSAGSYLPLHLFLRP